jgi:hypothetical protein
MLCTRIQGLNARPIVTSSLLLAGIVGAVSGKAASASSAVSTWGVCGSSTGAPRPTASAAAGPRAFHSCMAMSDARCVALNRTNPRARARKTRCSGVPNSGLSSNPGGGGPAASTPTLTTPLASHPAVSVRSGPVSLASTALLACCLASSVLMGADTGTK